MKNLILDLLIMLVVTIVLVNAVFTAIISLLGIINSTDVVVNIFGYSMTNVNLMTVAVTSLLTAFTAIYVLRLTAKSLVQTLD